MPQFYRLRQKIGKATLRMVIWTFQWASIIKYVPFEPISKDRLRVRVYPALWRRCVFYGVSAIVLGYNLFQTIGFLRNIGVNGLTADSVLHIVYFSYAILSTLFFVTFVTKPEEGAMLINQLDYLMEASRHRRLGYKRCYGTGFSILTVNYYVPLLQLVAAPTLVALFVMNPHGSMYIYSIIPSRLQAELWVKVVCFLLEVAMVYWNFTNLNAMYCVWTSIVFQNILWLDRLRSTSEAHGSWDSELILMTFRYVRVLNILHNDFNQHFAAGFIGILSMFAVLFIYCVLTTINLVSIFVYVLFPTVGGFCVFLIVVFYPYITSWEFKSLDFLQRIHTEVLLSGGPAEREILLREMKALKAVRNKLSFFGHSSIAVSQASLEEIFSDVLLLMSF